MSFASSDLVDFSSMQISTSDIVLELLVERSDAMDMLSMSSISLFADIFRTIATKPITPAIDNMVMTKIGTIWLLYGGCESTVMSSLTETEENNYYFHHLVKKKLMSYFP